MAARLGNYEHYQFHLSVVCLDSPFDGDEMRYQLLLIAKHSGDYINYTRLCAYWKTKLTQLKSNDLYGDNKQSPIIKAIKHLPLKFLIEYADILKKALAKKILNREKEKIGSVRMSDKDWENTLILRMIACLQTLPESETKNKILTEYINQIKPTEPIISGRFATIISQVLTEQSSKHLNNFLDKLLLVLANGEHSPLAKYKFIIEHTHPKQFLSVSDYKNFLVYLLVRCEKPKKTKPAVNETTNMLALTCLEAILPIVKFLQLEQARRLLNFLIKMNVTANSWLNEAVCLPYAFALLLSINQIAPNTPIITKPTDIIEQAIVEMGNEKFIINVIELVCELIKTRISRCLPIESRFNKYIYLLSENNVNQIMQYLHKQLKKECKNKYIEEIIFIIKLILLFLPRANHLTITNLLSLFTSHQLSWRKYKEKTSNAFHISIEYTPKLFWCKYRETAELMCYLILRMPATDQRTYATRVLEALIPLAQSRVKHDTVFTLVETLTQIQANIEVKALKKIITEALTNLTKPEKSFYPEALLLPCQFCPPGLIDNQLIHVQINHFINTNNVDMILLMIETFIKRKLYIPSTELIQFLTNFYITRETARDEVSSSILIILEENDDGEFAKLIMRTLFNNFTEVDLELYRDFVNAAWNLLDNNLQENYQQELTVHFQFDESNDFTATRNVLVFLRRMCRSFTQEQTLQWLNLIFEKLNFIENDLQHQAGLTLAELLNNPNLITITHFKHETALLQFIQENQELYSSILTLVRLLPKTPISKLEQCLIQTVSHFPNQQAEDVLQNHLQRLFIVGSFTVKEAIKIYSFFRQYISTTMKQLTQNESVKTILSLLEYQATPHLSHFNRQVVTYYRQYPELAKPILDKNFPTISTIQKLSNFNQLSNQEQQTYCCFVQFHRCLSLTSNQPSFSAIFSSPNLNTELAQAKAFSADLFNELLIGTLTGNHVQLNDSQLTKLCSTQTVQTSDHLETLITVLRLAQSKIKLEASAIQTIFNQAEQLCQPPKDSRFADELSALRQGFQFK